MLVFLCSCGLPEAAADTTASAGKVTYVIEVDGRKIDTAYLYAYYQDRGAAVVVYVDGMQTCREAGFVPKTTGAVNTRLPGVYSLSYSATDLAGNELAAVTRTVHVVENKAGFLSGNYDAACSCTAAVSGSSNPTITTGNYTAVVTPGSADRRFCITTLNIGPEYVTADACLTGNYVEAGYFSPDYANLPMSGTLSATKNTFTIESKAHAYSPAVIHRCRNVYNRQLIINGQVANK